MARTIEYSTKFRVEFDASPWGGAGIYYEDGEPVEFFILFWERIAHLNVPVGDCAFQTFWEFLTLAMCLVRW